MSKERVSGLDQKKRQEQLIAYGQTKKAAEVYFREDWQSYYFSLKGKCFGMMNQELITLKGPVAENEQLRECYQDIIPGYYANKTHWNSIYLKTKELSTEEIQRLIDCSYQLVFQKFPKKEQRLIGQNDEMM